MLIEKFLGTYSVRDLRENEVYFCQEGCGDCNKVLVEEDNMTKHSIDDQTLLERHYSKVELSSCCRSELGIWNELEDEEISVEYSFTPNEES